MNGGRGIKKGCLLVFFVKGARIAIVYVLTVLETQNLEPDRTILSFTVAFVVLVTHCTLPDPRAVPSLLILLLPNDPKPSPLLAVTVLIATMPVLI